MFEKAYRSMPESVVMQVAFCAVGDVHSNYSPWKRTQTSVPCCEFRHRDFANYDTVDLNHKTMKQ